MANQSNPPPARNLPSSIPPQNRTQQAPAAKPAAAKKPMNIASLPFWFGTLASVVWVGTVVFIILKAGPAHSFGGLPLVNWAIAVSAIVPPIALIWMLSAYLQRAADVQSIAEPLRRQLMMITGESGAAEARIRRFNQAIREQLDLLRGAQHAGSEDLMSILERVRQHKDDLERFEAAGIHQVKEIQDIVRNNMQHIERLMDDKFTMMRVLDERLMHSGDSVGRQVESVRGHITEMLDALESNATQLASALERSLSDSKKLADTARTQESSLLTAAENAAEMLNGVSGKIDLSIARFLERAGTARGEAEHLASTLDAQTRALDEFSNTLPARVSEAEAVLRGVADRLYVGERMAREQAVNLSDKLSTQVDGLQKFLDTLGERLVNFDGGLQKRRDDLESMLNRVGSSTDTFIQRWESSVTDLGERTNNSLQRFSSVNEDTRKGVAEVIAQLTVTTDRYEGAAVRMQSLSSDSASQLKTITSEIAAQLTQFESLRDASSRAGHEVEQRAAAALQNLQMVLERLATARETTHSVGETLVKDLCSAVDQNEQLIGRLNEAAQMSVRALGIAAESLGRQEGELASQARSAEAMLQEAIMQTQSKAAQAEKGLRDQATHLMSLLSETQDKLNATDAKLQSFTANSVAPIQSAVHQIDLSAEAGLRSLGRYGEGMQEQLTRLQQFTGRVGGIGEELGRIMSENVNSIEQLSNRFTSARSAQEETARQTLDQFASMADRLQREISSLGDQTGQAVSTLQQAAQRVGEQSNQLQQDAQSSASQMQVVTSALQNEASQIRSILQKQTDDLGVDLSRAEKQFLTIGEALKQRTDSAYTLLDRVAAHYNEVTRTAAQELDARTQRFEQSTVQAQSKADAFSASLQQQMSLINGSGAQLEGQAAQVTAVGNKTVQQLTQLNEKLQLTHEAANNNAQTTIARLDECNTAFMRQSNSLSDAAQNAVAQINKAGSAFNDQAAKMLDNSHQTEQQIRNLSVATLSLSEQSSQIRTSMEQQSQRLLNQMNDVVVQLDAASSKLTNNAVATSSGADQAISKLAEVAQTTANRLHTSEQELQGIITRTESTLSTLGGSITQQTASLSVVHDQISDQFRAISGASESQRAQLIELFDKLGSAHGQASDVAERTIARLTESLQQIQRQLGALSDQSQSAIANVRTAGSGFADQAGNFLQNAQQAEQQARTVLSVTSALQDQARQLREALHTEGDRTNEMLGTLLGKISAGGTELRDLGSSAELILTSLQNGVQQQTQGLSSSMQQISERQRALTIALDAQRDVINGLLNRFVLAQDETASSTERNVSRLSDSTQTIARQLGNIDTQAQSVLANVQAASTKFADETGSFQQHAQQAEQQARSILTSTAALQDQARQLREGLHTESERSGDVLNSMISKISAGGNELREFGKSAEYALSALQTGVSQQTQTLHSALQQTTDRQRALTLALESQRDVVNDMFNRLVLAQDEAASTSERTASRLSDSTSSIAKQLSALDSQAQTTLSNVQSAGAKFADEAGSLTLHAQQAEQQMRAVLSVTAGMQEQARTLRESMHGETAHVVTQLTEIIARLDQASGHLKQQSSTALHAMDQSATQMESVTRNSSDQLQRHAENLAAVVVQSEERLNNTDQRMRGHLRLISETTEQTAHHGQQIADTIESAVSCITILRDTMTDSDRQGRAVLGEATARIDEVRDALKNEMLRLTEVSQTASQQVTVAAHDLSTQSDALRANLASSESALAEAARLVREESVQVPATISRSTTQIEAATETLKTQAFEADRTLVGTADRFISVTGTARATMIDEMKQISRTAAEAETLLHQYNKGLAEQVHSMQSSAELISEKQKDLIVNAGDSITQLTVASERLGQLRGDAAESAAKLAREFESMELRAQTTSQRLVQAGESVDRTLQNLGQATERAEGQMMAASNGFREQFERIRNGVQGQIDDINRGLMQITAQLERTGTALRSTTAGTVSDVEKIASRFDQTSREAATQLADKTTHMRGATEEVAKLLHGLGDQLDVLLDRLAMAGDGIKRHEGGIVTQLQTALSHLGSVAERLETSRTLAGNVSEHAVARLSEVASTVEHQLENISTKSEGAANVLRNASRIYGEQSQTLGRGVGEAQQQVVSMNKSIEEMQQRTDRMRVSLKMQSEELMISLQQILNQLSAVGDGMGETVNSALREQGVGGLGKIS